MGNKFWGQIIIMTSMLSICLVLCLLGLALAAPSKDISESELDKVLISKHWKTSAELETMTKDDKRNAIIVELSKLTNKKTSFLQTYKHLQTLSNGKLMNLAETVKKSEETPSTSPATNPTKISEPDIIDYDIPNEPNADDTVSEPDIIDYDIPNEPNADDSEYDIPDEPEIIFNQDPNEPDNILNDNPNEHDSFFNEDQNEHDGISNDDSNELDTIFNPDQKENQTPNPKPHVFPNSNPLIAEPHKDTGKQVNMYYVNNVVIHA